MLSANYEVKQTVFAIMIKFSSWVDCDSYCSSINCFQKHRKEAEAQAFLSLAKAHLFTSFPFTNIRYLSHRMPLVKVSQCLLTEKKHFYSSHSISCPLFCVVPFILKTNSPFTIHHCVVFSIRHSFYFTVNWAENNNLLVWCKGNRKKIASFPSKMNCVTWCVFFQLGLE